MGAKNRRRGGNQNVSSSARSHAETLSSFLKSQHAARNRPTQRAQAVRQTPEVANSLFHSASSNNKKHSHQKTTTEKSLVRGPQSTVRSTTNTTKNSSACANLEAALVNLRALYAPHACLPAVIPLNVGGEIFAVAARTIALAAPESILYRTIVARYCDGSCNEEKECDVSSSSASLSQDFASFISNNNRSSCVPVDHKGRIYLDHDPSTFRFLLNRLRGYGSGNTCRSDAIHALVGGIGYCGFGVPGFSAAPTAEQFEAVRLDAALLGISHVLEYGTLSIGGSDDGQRSYPHSIADTNPPTIAPQGNKSQIASVHHFDPLVHVMESRCLANGELPRLNTPKNRKRVRDEECSDVRERILSGNTTPSTLDSSRSSGTKNTGAAHNTSCGHHYDPSDPFAMASERYSRAQSKACLSFMPYGPGTSRAGLRLSSRLTVGTVGPPMFPGNGGRHEVSFYIEEAEAIGIGIISDTFCDFSDDFGTNHPGCASFYNNGKFSHMFPNFTSEFAAMRYGAGCIVTVVVDFQTNRLSFEVGGTGALNYSNSSTLAEPITPVTLSSASTSGALNHNTLANATTAAVSISASITEPNGTPVPRCDFSTSTNINSSDAIIAGRVVALTSFALGCPQSFQFAVALMGHSSVMVARRPSPATASLDYLNALSPEMTPSPHFLYNNNDENNLAQGRRFAGGLPSRPNSRGQDISLLTTLPNRQPTTGSAVYEEERAISPTQPRRTINRPYSHGQIGANRPVAR